MGHRGRKNCRLLLIIALFFNPLWAAYSFEHYPHESGPLVLFLPGHRSSLSSYRTLALRLKEEGFNVILMQTHLENTLFENEKRSFMRHAEVIDNLFSLFEKFPSKRVALIGHSMGANALLLLASRVEAGEIETLLPHCDREGVKECVVLLDPGGYPAPTKNDIPCLFQYAGEKELPENVKKHLVYSYPKASHTSFKEGAEGFKGTEEEKRAFITRWQEDLLGFLRSCLDSDKGFNKRNDKDDHHDDNEEKS